MADLDDIVWVLWHANDLSLEFKAPHKHEYPQDWQRSFKLEFGAFLENRQKFQVHVVEVRPQSEDHGIGKVVSFSIWDMEPGLHHRNPGDTDKGHRRHLDLGHEQSFYELMDRIRRKYSEGYQNKYVDLWWMQTHPSFRRRGYATMLMQPGLDASDKLRVPAVVNASPMGKLLYESIGFELVGHEYVVSTSDKARLDIDILRRESRS